MNHELTVWEQENQPLVQRGIDEYTWNAIVTSIFPGVSYETALMAVDYCRARDLDIMLKPVHAVPMSVKQPDGNYRSQEVILPGIGLYRIQAARAGNMAGQDAPVFGPDVIYRLNGVDYTVPEWCEVTVHKMIGDRVVPFTAREYWLENYATAGRNTDAPNTMWKKRVRGQLAKCFDDLTEILTVDGFKKFIDVDCDVMQVTNFGIEPVSSKPFSQDYYGEMILSDGSRSNYCVTTNHDMITKNGKIEAGNMYKLATKDNDKFKIPMSVICLNTDAVVDDNKLILIGALLADGSHTGFKQWRIGVSRNKKVNLLNKVNLHSKVDVKKDAGRISFINEKKIETKKDKTLFVYNDYIVSEYINFDKTININKILSLSSRQAKVIVDTLVLFDGSNNGDGVMRLLQKNKNVISSFELLAIHAGYSVSKNKHNDGCFSFTISKKKWMPVVKGVKKNKSSLVKTENKSGKVWCVTVPSGAIVVRRKGFSMICGNCTEAQALRKAWPEVGAQATADEMEGRTYEPPERDITPQAAAQNTAQEAPTLTRLLQGNDEANTQQAVPTDAEQKKNEEIQQYVERKVKEWKEYKSWQQEENAQSLYAEVQAKLINQPAWFETFNNLIGD